MKNIEEAPNSYRMICLQNKTYVPKEKNYLEQVKELESDIYKIIHFGIDKNVTITTKIICHACEIGRTKVIILVLSSIKNKITRNKFSQLARLGLGRG